MTNPFAVQPGGVVQGQGIGGALQGGLAQVLAQMQISKENQFRMQELENQQRQQQALQQYYEAMARAQQDEMSAKAGQQAIVREGSRQVGAAQRAALLQGQGLPSQILEEGAASIPPNLSSVFGGVADENLPAAVKGVQEVQQLTPKPPELPTSGKEFEYLKRLAARNPEQAMLYKQLFLDPKPSTVINNIPAQGETEFSKELAKAQVALLGRGETDARQAQNAFPAMDEAYKLVNRSFTGFGANQLVTVARVLGAAGIKPSADKAANTQTMVKLLRDQTLAYLQTRALGSGTAVSDKDREFMERQSAADPTLQPGAMRRIIRINVGVGLMKTKEAIDDLQDQAMAYPQNAQQLNVKRQRLQQQYDVQWRRYSQMLAEEEASDQAARRIMAPQADSLFPVR